MDKRQSVELLYICILFFFSKWTYLSKQHYTRSLYFAGCSTVYFWFIREGKTLRAFNIADAAKNIFEPQCSKSFNMKFGLLTET